MGTVIFVLCMVGAILASIYLQKRQQRAKEAYYQSLALLKQNPADPDLRELALSLGRIYSNLTRNSKGVTLHDEVALMNDIGAACAASAATRAAGGMGLPAQPKTTGPTIPLVSSPNRKSNGIRIVLGVVGVLCLIGLLGWNAESPTEAAETKPTYDCPDGATSSGDRMSVTAEKLNVRSGPSTGDARLEDATLTTSTTVTEECRAGSWSRLRLADGRTGWVANEYLKLNPRPKIEATGGRQVSDTEFEVRLASMAKESVRERLNDPDSAQFSDVSVYRANGVACGYVNAKNGFGGYAGRKAFMSNGMKITVLEDDMDYSEFRKAWSNVCQSNRAS